MKNHPVPLFVFVSASLLAAGACARTPSDAQTAASPPAREVAAAPVAQAPVDVPAAAQTAFPMLVVHKSPTCGCCQAWVEHMRNAGFEVDVREADNLEPVKSRVGVPLGKGSCHTAEIAGYFIEGHVPAEDVKRLLADKPAARGLVLPGMPMGSPGMEMPDGSSEPFAVELVDSNGSTTVFARH